MKPEERRCDNCWCWRRDERTGVHVQGYCRLQPVYNIWPPEGGCCAEHRTAEEQALLWKARAAEARFTMHDFGKIQHDAETSGRVEECLAVVKWLRELTAAAYGDPTEESVMIDNLAARIEAGAHRQIAEVKP